VAQPRATSKAYTNGQPLEKVNQSAGWCNEVERRAAPRLDPQTLQAMVQPYQAGTLTLDALLQAMLDGDLLPHKAVVADEGPRLGGRTAAAAAA
jgi:hypothetical protein